MSSTKFQADEKRGRPTDPVKTGTLGAQVREARRRLGLSGEELASRVGLDQSSISRIERNVIEPERTTLVRLAQELGTSFGDPSLVRHAQGTRKITIEAYVAAGQPIDEIIEDETVLVDPDFIKSTGDVCALKVKGDSMVEDHMLNGDILICRRNPGQPRKDSIVVVDLRNGKGAAVKRWRRKGDSFTLSSDHYDESMEKYLYSMAEIGKLYEVVGLVRSMK